MRKLPGFPARGRLPAVVLAVLMAAATAATIAQEESSGVYKWVDEDGNVTYQDRPPPANQQQEQLPDVEESPVPASTPQSPVELVLYSERSCAQCDRVRGLLRDHGVSFEEKFIDGKPQIRAELESVADVVSVPALIAGGAVIMGYNEALILEELVRLGVISGAGSTADTGFKDSAREDDRITREELEAMTPEEVEQAARDAALRGEDNDLFEEDEGFNTLNDDIFSGAGIPSGGDGGDAIERDETAGEAESEDQ